MKYTAFINSLLTELEDSNLCCSIERVKISPLGYADDVASASTSKYRLDKVMKIVYDHSNRWRYQLNAKKCAVLVYGESKKENARNSKERVYRLGTEKVEEKSTYDHVGLKNCVGGDYTDRIVEKISKGRKALCAASGIGFKKGGLTLKICCFIYWTIIVPIVTYAAELWVLNDADIEKLDKFHRYAGRKAQRFHQRAPITTSYECLGWMRLENFVYAKKLLFIRSIAMQDGENIYLKICRMRMSHFNGNIQRGVTNVFLSPIFDILRVSIIYGLYEEVCRMLSGITIFSKSQWKQLVWNRAWQVEKDSWHFTTNLYCDSRLITRVMGTPGYCIWWYISDIDHTYIRRCEVMVKLMCNVSKLKSDDYKYDSLNFSERVCSKCDSFTIDNAEHVILQCSGNAELREYMFCAIDKMPYGVGSRIVARTNDLLATILGKMCDDIDIEYMIEFFKIVCTWVNLMYIRATSERLGVG